MKMQFAQIIQYASDKGRGAISVILFLVLAFAVPRMGTSQDPNKPVPVPASPEAAGQLSHEDSASSEEDIQSGTITDLETAQQDGDLVVSVMMDRLVVPKEFTLKDPTRLVFDFVNAETKVDLRQLPVNFANVKQLRLRQFQNSAPKIARLVFDLEEDYGSHEIVTSENCTRIVFHDVNGEMLDTTASTATEESSSEPAPQATQPQRDVSPPKVAASAKPEPLADAQPQQDASQPEFVAAARHEFVPAAQPQRNLAQPEVASPPMLDSTQNAPEAAPHSQIQKLAPYEMPRISDFRFSGEPLTLDLVDISLVDFFRLMAEEGGINVVLDPEVKGNISIKVVAVPWDQILESVLVNNNLDKQVEGNLVRIARKSTLQDEAKQQEALKRANLLASDIETRIKRLNYAKAATFVDILADQKTVRGSIVVDERTNSLILTDIPASLNKLDGVIQSLDVPQPQVEIEARIVSATREFARDIGIQFGFVEGNLQRVTVGGPNTFGTIGGTRPMATPTNTYAAGNPITGRGASEDTTSKSAGVSTGNGDSNAGNLNVNLPAQKAFGGLGISIGNIFDTFLLDAAITAGETKGVAKLISQPKVTAQNNSAAVITQGLRFPVQIIANNTVSIQFQNAALTLVVTPQITYEGNIVLDLKVENNTPDFSRSVNGIPSIRTSESTTRVLVSDGGTTVIGGILIEVDSQQEDRVPGLAALPLVGNLFRRNAVNRSTEEVLFFITPRVIK